MTEGNEGLEGVGSLIDDMLTLDDGKILANLVRVRANLTQVFGKQGLVEELCRLVEASPSVSFFSRRSRVEVDPNRPALNLKVDSEAAKAAHPGIVERLSLAEGVDLEMGSFENGGDNDSQHLIVAFKSRVIHEEVCVPLLNSMDEALRKHWISAKLQQLDGERALLLIMSNIFAVSIAMDPSPTKGRMCTLRMMI